MININPPLKRFHVSSQHISSNVRIILDLMDYSEYLDEGALILFSDFRKAFDTFEHTSLLKCFYNFGFGWNFILVIQIPYGNIDCCVLLHPNVMKRFSVLRLVRQAWPIFPFCYSWIIQLLSDKDIKMTQRADDFFFLWDKL